MNKKVILVVSMASLLGAFISITGFLYFNHKELENGLINKARTIHTQLGAATSFVANQGGLASVIEKFKARYPNAEALSESDKKEILNQVPIYAAMMIGKQNQQKDHYKFRVFSDEPRRKENLATAREAEILRRFSADGGLTEVVEEEGVSVTVYRPVYLDKSQGCLSCHGDPATSPWRNGTDILGYKMEGWGDHKLHGVFAVTQDSKEAEAAANSGSLIAPSGWLIGGILFAALMSIFMAVVFMKPSVKMLSKAANDLLSVSRMVNDSSSNVAETSQRLSKASVEQAASLEETATSLEEITAMIAKASDGATAAANKSAGSQATAESGKDAVRRMLEAMENITRSNESIRTQVEEGNRQMAEIVNVIREIGNKTKVINEIVFQTKLLSFNASVEAARAGENGKGFAVVAEEVGNLARMSGDAAKEISDMLEGSIKKVELIVESTQKSVAGLIDDGKAKVTVGSETANQCAEALDQIVVNVAQVSDLSSQISHASREQSQGVAEINKAMSLLGTVTQENASTSESSAAAAEKLAMQADQLRTSVESLFAVVQGAGKVPTSSLKDLKVLSFDSARRKREGPSTAMLAKASSYDAVPSAHDPAFEEE